MQSVTSSISIFPEQCFREVEHLGSVPKFQADLREIRGVAGFGVRSYLNVFL